MKRVGPHPNRRRKTDDPQWAKFFTDEEKAAAHRQELFDTSLADTTLSVRVVNTLEEEGIEHVRDLVKLDRNELLAIENFGDKTLEDCRAAMDALGVEHPNWKAPSKKRPTH